MYHLTKILQPTNPSDRDLDQSLSFQLPGCSKQSIIVAADIKVYESDNANMGIKKGELLIGVIVANVNNSRVSMIVIFGLVYWLK